MTVTDLSKQSSEGLTNADPSDDDVAEIEKRVRSAYAQELEDAIRYRRRFFWWGVTITSVCVLASIGMIVFLVFRNTYETPVGVAFISGLAVEVVGVAVVIAKYLFPDGGANSSRLPAPSVSEEDDA